MLHESDLHAQCFWELVEVSRESDDPNTQNAAGVLERPGARWLAGKSYLFAGTGVNGVPYSISPDPERLASPAKYDWFIHAEFSALLHAGHTTGCGTLYGLWVACPSCAVAIVEAGISTVVTLKATQDATPERWRARVDLGLEILRAAGIEIEFYDKPLGKSIRFDGKELTL